MKKTARFFLTAWVCVFVLAACGSPFVSANPSAAAPTQSAILSTTDVPTREPSMAPTSEPTTPPIPVLDRVETRVQVTSLNLRAGPGTVFPIVGKLAEKTLVTAVEKTRGDEWVLVDTGNQQGWVSAAFLDLYGSDKLAALVVKDFTGGFVVHGRVVDSAGAPVRGIVFAVVKDDTATSPRTNAQSLADGNFYAYLPSSAAGSWRVDRVAVDCKSPIVDANCKFAGRIAPASLNITLPDDKNLAFTYIK